MSEKKEAPGGEASNATRRRKNLAGRDGGRVSRPVLIAVVVLVAAGAYLFWPRGGGAPSGIGDQFTVVTADTTAADAPRSGSVDIDEHQQDLVPERPEGAAPAEAAPATEAPAETTPATTPPPPPAERKPAPKTTPPAESSAPAEAQVAPRPTGPWAVQIGAFGKEANAQKLVGDLAGKGITAHTRAASTSSGDMVYRVWIGWFASREDAALFARQQKKIIGDAYPVHR